MTKFRGERIGIWPLTSHWYSVCSAHQQAHKAECPRCMAGYYVNDVSLLVDHFIYRRWKTLWLWLHNPYWRQRGTLKLRRRWEEERDADA